MARSKNPPGSVDWRLYRRCLECGVDRRQICRDEHDNRMKKPCAGRVLLSVLTLVPPPSWLVDCPRCMCGVGKSCKHPGGGHSHRSHPQRMEALAVYVAIEAGTEVRS